MSWVDRLQQAAYTSPSGVRLTFGFEDVRRAFTKKTGGFNFADANGTYVQDLGHTGRRYPLRMFFWGSNYDLEADTFEAALMETGIGKLEHPIYGTSDVIPFGEVTRRDDLKTAANQAVIEVVFWATIGLVYPTGQVDLAGSTLAALEAFNAAEAAEYAAGIGDIGAARQSILADKYNGFLDTTEAALRDIADTQQDVQRQFDAITDSIDRGIDVLVADPLTLAFQTSQMIQAPARALTAITARLDAYANLAQSIFAPTTLDDPEAEPLDNDELRTRDLYAKGYNSGSILSSVNADLETKTDAIEAAESILDQMTALTTWRDVAYPDSEQVDTGAGYQALQEASALSVAFLIQISFSLKQERRIVLDRNRTIVDLAAELYNDVPDSHLDFLINSNDLSGSEILELPKGRTIVYYI